MNHILLRGALFAAAIALLPASTPWGEAMAQSTYPNRPIRIIIAFPGGSATDLMVRTMAEPVREILGQPIIVEPKPGAGATVAANYVLQQPPDGYTLMASTSSITITSSKPNPPFDARKMSHVIMAVGGPLYISVNAQNVKATTLQEFIDYARANPGKVNFGSYGAGSLGHLAVELFNRTAGIKTVHIPLNGSAADAQAVSSGTTDASMNNLTFIEPLAQAGKLRILAGTSAERAHTTPGIPGMRESGVDMNVIYWQGVAGPPGMPRDVVSKLNAAYNAGLKTPPVIDYFSKVKTDIYGGSPEQMTNVVNREVEVWSKLIKDANIAID